MLKTLALATAIALGGGFATAMTASPAEAGLKVHIGKHHAVKKTHIGHHRGFRSRGFHHRGHRFQHRSFKHKKFHKKFR